MKVLHVISGLDPVNGGPAIALAGMARAQVAAGLDVTMVATWVNPPDQGVLEQLRSASIEVNLIGPCRNPMSRHSDIPTTLDRLVTRADVVHIHALWEEVQHQAFVAARRHKVPYVITPHGMLSRWSLSHRRLKKRVYLAWRLRRNLRSAGAIHFTTTAEREASRSVCASLPSLVEPLGVDLSDFDPLPPSGAFRNRHRVLRDRPFVLFLGRIHPGKGLECLVPAMSLLRDKTTMLVVIGPDSGGYQATIEKLVDSQGLRERVIFTGMLTGTDKVSALRDADLFALPSEHENFGVAIIEALAAGTPVIISDQVNICHEIAAANVGGVTSVDPKAVAAEMERWLGDVSLRNAGSGRALAFAREMFQWAPIAKRWCRHYESLCAGLRDARTA